MWKRCTSHFSSAWQRSRICSSRWASASACSRAVSAASATACATSSARWRMRPHLAVAGARSPPATPSSASRASASSSLHLLVLGGEAVHVDVGALDAAPQLRRAGVRLRERRRRAAPGAPPPRAARPRCAAARAESDSLRSASAATFTLRFMSSRGEHVRSLASPPRRRAPPRAHAPRRADCSASAVAAWTRCSSSSCASAPSASSSAARSASSWPTRWAWALELLTQRGPGPSPAPATARSFSRPSLSRLFSAASSWSTRTWNVRWRSLRHRELGLEVADRLLQLRASRRRWSAPWPSPSSGPPVTTPYGSRTSPSRVTSVRFTSSACQISSAAGRSRTMTASPRRKRATFS